MSSFFDRTWDQPSSNLKRPDQGFVLNQAAFALRALGRLQESAQPMRTSVDMDVRAGSWQTGAREASNPSALARTDPPLLAKTDPGSDRPMSPRFEAIAAEGVPFIHAAGLWARA
jgi:hypothetical protein